MFEFINQPLFIHSPLPDTFEWVRNHCVYVLLSELGIFSSENFVPPLVIFFQADIEGIMISNDPY